MITSKAQNRVFGVHAQKNRTGVAFELETCNSHGLEKMLL